jgi:hypothetical protein
MAPAIISSMERATIVMCPSVWATYAFLSAAALPNTSAVSFLASVL